MSLRGVLEPGDAVKVMADTMFWRPVGVSHSSDNAT